jgi:hypothetical protein
MRLAEVGASGQNAIESASMDLPLVGFPGDVAARYLAGAGVGRLRVRDESLAAAALSVDSRIRVEVVPSLEVENDISAFDLRERRAIELAAGSLVALRGIRRALNTPR